MTDADEKWALDFIAQQIVKSIKRGIICLLDPRNCEIPLCWDSDEGGMAYEWKNAVAIFQINPRQLQDEMCPKGSAHQDREWNIRRAMACYFKKGQNPSDPAEGSVTPFLVLSQMVDKKGRSFIRKYTPTGYVDQKVQDAISPDSELFNSFMSELVTADPTADLPVKIEGGLSEASLMCVGEDKTRKTNRQQATSSGSGCLSMLLILVGIPVVLFVCAFC